jgi:predicted O-methyltransferase YrrM
MGSSGTDKVFAGSIPKFYETYLVPLLFEPYAADLVSRLASRSLGRVLEVAAGTGVVTRALASVLPERVSIVATDLNQPMLDQASALGTERPVECRQADAMQLPFQDGLKADGHESRRVTAMSSLQSHEARLARASFSGRVYPR